MFMPSSFNDAVRKVNVVTSHICMDHNRCLRAWSTNYRFNR